MSTLASGLAVSTQRPWHVGLAAVAVVLALAGPLPGRAVAHAAGIGVLLAWLRSPRLAATAAALLLAGAAVGDARLAAIDGPADRVPDGKRVPSAPICSAPCPNPFGASAEAESPPATSAVRGWRAASRGWAQYRGEAGVGAEAALESRAPASPASLRARSGSAARSRAPPSTTPPAAPPGRRRRAAAGGRAGDGAVAAESPGCWIGCESTRSRRSRPGCRPIRPRSCAGWCSARTS